MSTIPSVNEADVSRPIGNLNVYHSEAYLRRHWSSYFEIVSLPRKMHGFHQDAALLRAYFGGEPPAHEVGRMVAYKAMCDLLWTLWGVIQHVNQNPVDDFWAYAVGRFERCATLMSSADYSERLASVLAG